MSGFDKKHGFYYESPFTSSWGISFFCGFSFYDDARIKEKYHHSSLPSKVLSFY
jgi:hypothetical protein